MTNQTTELALGDQPQINTMGIDMDALISEWTLAKSYVEQYTRDFVTLDNLVDAIPINPDPDAPFVGDTTLAGLVRSIPRDSLEQLPTYAAIVNGSKYNLHALICSYLLKKFVFNEDTFGRGLLSTLQIGAEQALTHGYAPFMCGVGTLYNDFGATLRLLHYSDTAPEPGITDHNETGFDYVVANLTKSRVKKILKNAIANPDSTWNVHALQKVLEAAPRAKSYSIYQSAAERNSAGEAAGPSYEFVTRYETGTGGTIVTFCPEYTEEPLRVMESRSKWGYPRIMYLVIDPAGLTPFGKSRVRLASPTTNLMNIYLGSIASMLLLNAKPPVFKRGRFTTPVQLKQGVVWEALDPNATAELKNLDNGALDQFVPFSQQFAGQIQNIMGKKTGVANGNSGGQGYGKTGPGVKAAQDEDDTSTNQITKILENFLRQYALVALDTLVSEQDGDDNLIVDDDTKNAINLIAPGTVGADNKIHIVWADFYAAIEEWSVEVSVSISKDQLEEKKRGDLQDAMTVLGQNAATLGPDAIARTNQIADEIVRDAAPELANTQPPAPQMPAAPMPQPAPAAPVQ